MTEKPVEELTYEEAVKELEGIIQSLEGNSGALEDMIRLFERGQVLGKHCLNLLDKAELRIQTLANPDVYGETVL
ncbi:MAG TPA: exodeoxyribonuclease VII small subunit [Anaerolineaceae bacterium]|nr:exodeoxyribonuclease VII small subunit [Anaerolineaceae bacterium]HQN04313.1 exodeoxyribonuclease VII small subunit [Anaerolineaceae bacterium]HQP07934.1 exodeoxyribonuclease VII small subunit [Anaerolineaceae bacterium]